MPFQYFPYSINELIYLLVNISQKNKNKVSLTQDINFKTKLSSFKSR